MQKQRSVATIAALFLKMKNSPLNFVHLCENAFLSQDGKLNLIGIFRTLRAAKFPLLHPRIAVVTNLKIKKTTQLKIQILKTEAREVIAKFNVTLNVPPNEKNERETGFIADFANTKFEKSGNYQVEIWVDEKLERTVPFEFLEIKPMKK